MLAVSQQKQRKSIRSPKSSCSMPHGYVARTGQYVLYTDVRCTYISFALSLQELGSRWKKRVSLTSIRRSIPTRRKNISSVRNLNCIWSHIADVWRAVDINPLGLVPAFEYQGKALYESVILDEFLEDAYPDSSPRSSGEVAGGTASSQGANICFIPGRLIHVSTFPPLR